VPSPKVASYAEKPEMSAREITKAVLPEIEKKKHDLIIQNFANPDLVGHSGNLKATIKACEVLDECIGLIASKTAQCGYILIITADHGNAEYKIYEKNGDQCPSHTKNPVIFNLVSDNYKKTKLKKGSLQDIAPTILQILGVKKPKDMSGNSLITK
jgi:2,3-bisphosphoglycerate-independent phosphoglycerate mutase